LEALTMMTPVQMDGIYAALLTADDACDAEALAQICWRLYGEMGEARARADILHARLAAAARTVLPATAVPANGNSPGTLAAGEPCPGCEVAGQEAACVFCGQPQDPGCGYGVKHTPPSTDHPGQWRYTGCRAIPADGRRATGACS
jgi:hypothetical protein